jgi:NhaP-type Na+/H+ or K+/H+ antiporter
VWVVIYYAVYRAIASHVRGRPGHSRQLPTLPGALVVGWSGMRGIVTLAAALALPREINGSAFPYRDLIVFASFAVVLGTLVIQGLTLGPLLRAFNLRDDDPVEREVTAARDRALHAALDTVDGVDSEVARMVRQEFASHLRAARGADGDPESDHERLHRSALEAARRTILDMRANDEIGDDAFHQLEREFDWLEMANDPQD